MTRLASALFLLAILAGAPASAQDARDFQLPPAATATANPSVQGPVDTDAPVPVRPRVIETARPATPTPRATPTIVLPEPAPAQSQAASRAAVTGTPARAAPAPEARQAATSPATEALPTPSPSVALDAAPAAIATPAAPAALPRVNGPQPALPRLWIGIGGLIVAAGIALVFLRRRGDAAPPAIIAPVVPTAAATGEDALAISVEAVRMDRSVLNATVGYRVTLRNRTARALSGLAVEADLVSASRERPAEQQLASAGQPLALRHRAERLAPGQSLRFEGQVRLPLAEASAIWQGRAALLVPLLRIRATAAEASPVATTLVIGRAEGQASRPQPFRLDEPPRSYAPLAQRVLDASPARA